MREEIQEGEKNGKRLLHAQEAVERPFPMKLDDRIGFCDALIGNYMLASVVALSRAIPEEEAV